MRRRHLLIPDVLFSKGNIFDQYCRLGTEENTQHPLMNGRNDKPVIKNQSNVKHMVALYNMTGPIKHDVTTNDCYMTRHKFIMIQGLAPSHPFILFFVKYLKYFKSKPMHLE